MSRLVRDLRASPLTVEDHERIARMYSTGLSLRAVAAAHGVSGGTVLRSLKASGVKRRHRQVAKPKRIVLLFEAADHERIRKVSGRRGVSRWIRAVIREALR